MDCVYIVKESTWEGHASGQEYGKGVVVRHVDFPKDCLENVFMEILEQENVKKG